MSKRKVSMISGGVKTDSRRPLKKAVKKSASSTSVQALRVGGWANPTRSGELKFIDNNITPGITFGVNTFTTGLLLNGCVPGSAATERIGRKLTLKSLLIRYYFNLGAATTGGCQFRILVVYDKQANATAPAITDILLADAYNSPNNLSNRDRFVTIFDHVSDHVSVQGNYSVSGVLYKPLNMEVMFNAGNAGTIGDITSGSVYCFIAQTGSAGTANLSSNLRCRVRYSDV